MSEWIKHDGIGIPVKKGEMIDFEEDGDRMECRSAIAEALDKRSPELALFALERFGEPIREMLYDWQSSDEGDDSGDVESSENERDEAIEAIRELVASIESALDNVSRYL